MAEINLTQTEADMLIAMEKHRVNDDRWNYPGLGVRFLLLLCLLIREKTFHSIQTGVRFTFKRGHIKIRW